MALHDAGEDFADPARLARVLSRERAKDTTLDYPGRDGPNAAGDDLARRYAERRGLDPLRPESKILVRTEGADLARGPERAAEQVPAARRSRFAGLTLKTEPAAQTEPVRQAERAEPARPAAREVPLRTPAEIEREVRLRRALVSYAAAWADAGRMTAAGLPVLAHQAEAMARSGQALEDLAVNLLRDTHAALERAPALAREAASPAGTVALGVAVGAERQMRLELDGRGRAAVRAWNTLERAYTAAEQAYDSQAKREAGARLEAFAKALKADRSLDRVLREHGPELGIAPGSRLERVVQVNKAEITHALRHELGLRQGRGLSLGR